MIVATACRVDERKFVSFFFERDSWPYVARSWTLAVEEKDFAGQSIGYCFTDLMARLGLSEWLPNSVLFIP